MRCAFLFCLFLTASALAQDASGHRELVCRVVDEQGRGLPQVRVFLMGTERGSLDSKEAVQNPEGHPGWNFVTDDAGRFRVTLGNFADAGGAPGYGNYHLFAQPPGTAGGVSRLVVHWPAHQRKSKLSDLAVKNRPTAREWLQGEFAPLVLMTDKPAPQIDIVVKRGLTVDGVVVDEQGKPRTGVEVGVSLDLYYESHTGYGGEIFEQRKRTDVTGRFRFDHVYPNVFRIWPLLAGDEPIYWMKTRVRTRWFDRVEDFITPRVSAKNRLSTGYERRIPLRIVAARTLPYRYHGTVTDEAGRPVPNAAVSVQCSWHDPDRTFEDDHGSISGSFTDERGRYSLQAKSRFANWIQASAGDQTAELPLRGERMLAPGRHDLVLKAKGTKPTTDNAH